MRRLLCSSIADLKRLCLSMMCLSALSSPVRSSKAASSGCCFARSQSSKTPSCLVLLQSVKEQSRGRAARRLRDSIQAPSTRASRSHMSGRGPRRDRAAGRGGHDIHTLIFSSPENDARPPLKSVQRSESHHSQRKPKNRSRTRTTPASRWARRRGRTARRPISLRVTESDFYSLQEVALRLGRPPRRVD